jgi:Asp-tRNA(Asn)/Glu-tRNA(Gln) amidotransferase A subunit family amidase
LDELTSWSALAIAGAVRGRNVSAQEVLEAHLRRIEERNDTLNAIVTLVAESARARAAELDRALADGTEVGPLAGVPFTVKDLIATRGVRTTAGSRGLADFVPMATAPAVERLERAGAIMLGKTNCPELALDVHTSNRLFGHTRNPLDPERTPGGSSGGDSAAVAAGFAPLGIGTDYGGSLRWPAHCTGVVGFRGTPGLVPATGTLPFPATTDPLPPVDSGSYQARVQVIGPIARTVPDAWAALSVMAGPDMRDPFSVPVPLGRPEAVPLESLRIAWCDGDGTVPVREDLADVVAQASRELGRLGLDVREERPPGLETAEEIYAALRAGDGRHSRSDDRRMVARRDALRIQVLEFLGRDTVLLLPVASLPAFKIGQTEFHVGGVAIPRMNLVTSCRAVSLLGLPAIAVPAGRTADGLPVGVQIVGRPFADHVVAAVAAGLAGTSWSDGEAASRDAQQSAELR